MTSTCTIRLGMQDRSILEEEECQTQSTVLTMSFSTGTPPQEFSQTQNHHSRSTSNLCQYKEGILGQIQTRGGGHSEQAFLFNRLSKRGEDLLNNSTQRSITSHPNDSRLHVVEPPRGRSFIWQIGVNSSIQDQRQV